MSRRPTSRLSAFPTGIRRLRPEKRSMGSHRKKRFPLGIVGCGHMGTALLEGILREKVLPPSGILVADVRRSVVSRLQRRHGVVVCDTETLLRQSDVVVLAVKPQQMSEVLPLVRVSARRDATLISVAAGVTLKRLGRETGLRRIVRVMPNLPMKVGAGVIAWSAGSRAVSCGRVVNRLFSPSGVVFQVPEARMDAVTAISGSGPGYLFYLAEIFETLWREHGLPAALARQVVARLLIGAGRMLDGTGKDAATLRQMVSSPGGTTCAGLAVLQKRKIDAIFRDAVAAARTRSRELSR